ncbi:MAG: pantoate--beta-alanine ligase [Saprospiraceae bacterium]|nr:pantoate--beta-alanine ligase [Saprospiraceae bacterium]MBP7679455.1 pantoate--beta-alanine ligase [Saprospiraceae bacterium]
MFLFKKVADLQRYVQSLQKANQTIGFVPTMGALHTGHVSLIEAARKATDVVVCSIFVNPTQFNDPKDLEKYPRTETHDIEILVKAQCDILFLPTISEIYPPDINTTLQIDFGALETVMEGAFRPGHFRGMAQVVNRLLQIVQPQQLFMGQKDFQQVAIVQNMLRQQQSPVKLIMCPTLREPNGLAMSSRNVRLLPTVREHAAIIYKTLSETKENINTQPIAKLQHDAMQALAAVPMFRPEYVEIVDGNTLQPISSQNESMYIVACIATWAGDVRLIDNMILKSPK